MELRDQEAKLRKVIEEAEKKLQRVTSRLRDADEEREALEEGAVVCMCPRCV